MRSLRSPSPVRRRNTSSSDGAAGPQLAQRHVLRGQPRGELRHHRGRQGAVDHVLAPGAPRRPRAGVDPDRRGQVAARSSPGAAANRVCSSLGRAHELGRACRTRRGGRGRRCPTRSHSCSASSIACVVSTTVTPRSRSSRTSDHVVAPGVRVHARGRLVEEHQRRAPDQREGEREPLLLPAREPPHQRAARARRGRRARRSRSGSSGSS